MDTLLQKILAATASDSLIWSECPKNTFSSGVGPYALTLAVSEGDSLSLWASLQKGSLPQSVSPDPVTAYRFDQGTAEYTSLFAIVTSVRAEDTAEKHVERLEALLG